MSETLSLPRLGELTTRYSREVFPCGRIGCIMSLSFDLQVELTQGRMCTSRTFAFVGLSFAKTCNQSAIVQSSDGYYGNSMDIGMLHQAFTSIGRSLRPAPIALITREANMKSSHAIFPYRCKMKLYLPSVDRDGAEEHVKMGEKLVGKRHINPRGYEFHKRYNSLKLRCISVYLRQSHSFGEPAYN